ncbi:MAG: hypothetical protein AUJ75_03970 [Candidatus Omnitrophica bacterium CG1_02_49_10]|nr:MAG: hypothetical protein AUJ75_03970 [Candidatus Omnitrophica bacterium CG1_02_49_10]
MKALIITILCVISAGCGAQYNASTEQEELLLYSTEREVRLGRAIAKRIEKDPGIIHDADSLKRLDAIGQKIALVSERQDLTYHFDILNDTKDVNAMALPGGYVYVTKALLDAVANDDELASVLAHEVAHIAARHSVKKLQAALGYSILRIVTATAGDARVSRDTDIAFGQIMLGYSREDELFADKTGALYAKEAGYDPKAMVAFLEKLRDINKKLPIRPKSYARTHPYISDRIRVVKEATENRIDFDDYINTEDKESHE